MKIVYYTVTLVLFFPFLCDATTPNNREIWKKMSQKHTIICDKKRPTFKEFLGQQDKGKHIVGSFLLSVALGPIPAISIGIAKEIVYDKLMGKGTPDVEDVIADAIGVALGASL